jgi:hypothetical protein
LSEAGGMAPEVEQLCRFPRRRSAGCLA